MSAGTDRIRRRDRRREKLYAHVERVVERVLDECEATVELEDACEALLSTIEHAIMRDTAEPAKGEEPGT